MSLQLITIDTGDQTANDFKSVCPLEAGQLEACQSLVNYFGALEGGLQMAEVLVKVGAVQASGTITSAGTAGNNETMTLAGQTLTAKSSGAVPADGEFNVSATPATQATNIALAINSMPELEGIVTATALLGVVTVTVVTPGLIGNGIVMVDVNLANVTVVGMSGGADGTTYTLDLD